MIKIFGLRILNKDEQEYLESIMSGLIEIIDNLQDEIDLLIKAQLDKSKKPKTKKKSKK